MKKIKNKCKVYYEFWLPILKKQYFKYRLQNDIEAIIALESSVYKNWTFSSLDKREILQKIRGE